MKKLWIFSLLFVICVLCEPAGVSTVIEMDVKYLPEHLKDMKVYTVSIGDGQYVYVAEMNSTINSVCTTGKGSKATLILDKGFSMSQREIEIKSVILENDTMIIARKK